MHSGGWYTSLLDFGRCIVAKSGSEQNGHAVDRRLVLSARQDGRAASSLGRNPLLHLVTGMVLAVALAATALLAADVPGPSVDSTVREAMQKGQAAMAAGDFAAAVADYTVVTHALPQFAEGYFNLGLALQQAGHLNEARSALLQSVKLKPTLRGANLFLGLIAYRENRYQDAEVRLARETRLDPRDAKAFMWLGVCYLAQDNPQAAIAPLDRAYALDPKDPDILYHRGHAYLLMADASYAAMFRLNPDSMRVHQVLGEAYAKSYRTQQAITEFEASIKLAPHQPGLHEELADQYWVAGDLDKAAEAYREELDIDPYSVTSMYKLGSLLVVNMKPADGVELLENALREDPSLSDAHYYLGTGLMSLDKSQQAIQEFEKAIAADPGNDRAMSSWYKLALLYRKLDEQRAANDAMQNFLRMKDQVSAQQRRHTAQIVRDRTSLPVENPEKAAMTAVP